MAANTTTYAHECGYKMTRTSRPAGRCPQCKNFITDDTLMVVGSSTQNSTAPSSKKTSIDTEVRTKAQSITNINKSPLERIPTGIGELDRVLGGGFVHGEVVLLSGFPGSGKSTLSLKISESFAQKEKVLYSSGEESTHQIGLRAKRMNVDNENIRVIHETNLSQILAHIEAEEPSLVIVDSLQTVESEGVGSSIGSIAQSKEAAHVLTGTAKNKNICMVLISQVSKSGDFSGSEAIQHIVDATLMFESDHDSPLKFLRAKKNRFGDTTEVGIFQHSDEGLVEVADPSGTLIENDEEALEGVSRAFISEGVRQIPVEIHSLVTSEAFYSNPRITFEGADYGRGQMIIAALNKYCNVRMQDHDVFVGTVSGIKVKDPMSDLAIAAAILSSVKGKPSSGLRAFVGEVTLTGQVRGSFMIEHKIKEAERLGFEQIVIPHVAAKGINTNKYRGIKIKTIKRIADLKEML